MNLSVRLEDAGAGDVLRRAPRRLRSGLRAQVARSALAVERGGKQRAAVDTGRLRASIRPRFTSDGLGAEVFTDVRYGPHVEFGTARMAARPFLTPAAEAEQSSYQAGIRRVLQDL